MAIITATACINIVLGCSTQHAAVSWAPTDALISMCRHKYVKLAFHGFRKMTKDEKQAMYAQGTQRYSFDTDDFTTIDTLFSLAEAYLFMQVCAPPCKTPSTAQPPSTHLLE
jgi:hypothetical protein